MDSHMFAQLMCNTNIITQLPATVKFTPRMTQRASVRLKTDMCNIPGGLLPSRSAGDFLVGRKEKLFVHSW